MNISIFGGSGFIGYDFVRHALSEDSGLTPTVYSTSATSLTNLSRHNTQIELVQYGQLSKLQLPASTEYLINFSHPFATRDQQSPEQQISTLLRFMRRQLELLPHLKLIHVSSMSVYEPFAPDREFEEKDLIDPPRTDNYARRKSEIDKAILSWTHLLDRIQLLRPTVVYGPYCTPWTDNIVLQFLKGPLVNFGLAGKIQPLWVSDVSRFLLNDLADFKPGVYNLAGSETMSWKTFLAGFMKHIDGAEFYEISAKTPIATVKALSSVGKLNRAIVGRITNPSLRKRVRPYFRSMPASLKLRIKTLLFPNEFLKNEQGAQISLGPFSKEFFEEDRLVSTRKLIQDFQKFESTPFSSTADILRRYIKFRFFDGPFP